MVMGKNRPADPPPGERRKGRHLSDEDLTLWRHATRDDSRLSGHDDKSPASGGETAKAVKRPTDTPGGPVRKRSADAAIPAAGQPRLPPLQTGRTDGLDKRTAQRLRRGQIAIEARLDLHGLTQAEAHPMLNEFLGNAQAAGKRGVLVITGKGRADQGYGVLRRAVPTWLNQPPNRARIIAVHDAQPRDGGSGALYLLLRKRR